MLLHTLVLFASHILAATSTHVRRTSPTVQLDNATFTGTGDGTINKFLGIPYVQPPYVDAFILALKI